jgi:fusion and transport protein UGO1
MSSSREGPNPLRPYYRPPTIGLALDTPGTTTSGLGSKNGSAASYASSAREIFSDIDYSDYLSDSSPSSVESLQGMINDGFYKYLSILLSQPFDVAKTILQVRSQDLTDGSISIPMADDTRSRTSSYRDSMYSDVRTSISNS